MINLIKRIIIKISNNLLLKDHFFNILLLKKLGAQIGKNTRINYPLIIQNAIINYSNLIIGDNCHIGKNNLIDLASKVIIRNNVTISMGSSIITHIHMGDSKLVKLYKPEYKQVIIEDGNYIGANTTILMGVKIDKNNLIGAMSLVNKNIKGNKKIYGGVPCKLIKKMIK